MLAGMLSVKEKKGLLVAYHVLHDDASSVMNYARFAEFIKYLPRVSVRVLPDTVPPQPPLARDPSACPWLPDRKPRRTTPSLCFANSIGHGTARSACGNSCNSSRCCR